MPNELLSVFVDKLTKKLSVKNERSKTYMLLDLDILFMGKTKSTNSQAAIVLQQKS